MKKHGIRFTAVLGMLIVCSTDANARWEQTNGPWGGRIGDVAVCGSTIFAGTSSGLFRSTDRGSNWMLSGSGLPESPAIDNFTVSGGLIYARVYPGGVFSSGNQGVSWKSLDVLTGYNDPIAIEAVDNLIFAGSEFGIFRSTNSGETWQLVDSSLWVGAFCSHGTFLFVASPDEGIFRSSDKGRSWEKVHNGDARCFTVQGSSIFAGSTSGSIFRSDDTGTTWIDITPSNLPDASMVEFLSSTGTTLFTCRGSVLRSVDNGSSWTEVKHRGRSWHVSSMAVSGGGIFAGTVNNGVYCSTDNGETWSSVNTGIGNTEIMSLAVKGNTVVAGSCGGIFRSTDDGMSWSFVADELFYTDIRSFAMIDTMIFAGDLGGGVFRSADGGIQWEKADNGLPGAAVHSLAASGNKLFAATNGGLFISTDNGSGWTKADLHTNYPSAGFVAASNDIVLLQAFDGFFRSADKGATWALVGNGITGIKAFAETGGYQFVVNYEGIFRSGDKGRSWTCVYDTSGRFENLVVSGSTLFTVSWIDGIVFSSADCGETWAKTADTLNDRLYTHSIAANDNMLFVGTSEGGVWRRPVNEFANVTGVTLQPTALRKTAFEVRLSGQSGTISFQLSAPERITVGIFNLSGREVASLANAPLAPGSHRYSWNTGTYPTGSYMVRIRVGSRTFVRSMPIVR